VDVVDLYYANVSRCAVHRTPEIHVTLCYIKLIIIQLSVEAVSLILLAQQHSPGLSDQE